MEINNITFAYEDKVIRLKNIDDEVERGKITTILGPNGCGKSTLMGVMTNNNQAQSGDIVLEGKSLQQYKPKELARTLGVVHQENSAPNDLTVEKLVYYGRLPHRTAFSSQTEEDEHKVAWALKQTGLYERRNMSINALSGGQQQRVWIAMALAQDTPYLFLDEPTANLDIYYQYEILALVKQLSAENGLTVVMVLHDINQAIQYSDKIIAMKQGEIIASGDPRKIVTASLIEKIYGVHVIVKEDEQIGKYIVPIGI